MMWTQGVQLFVPLLLVAGGCRAVQDPKGASSGAEKGVAEFGESSATCCKELNLDSWGFSEDYQGARFGDYSLYSSTNDGRPVYKQHSGNNFIYFIAANGVWMVGPNIGEDYGGILNRESGNCPDQLTRDWEYWRESYWDDDFIMEANCNGGSGGETTSRPTLPPDAEPCTWGSACNGCAIWHEHNGVRYCCANNCDSGSLSVSSENGEVICWCSHP